jgi:hypothetical protein
MDEFVVQQAEESGLDFSIIPDDTMVNATVLGTERKVVEFKDGPTERMTWKFRIDDEPYLDRYVFGSTGTKIVNHPDCKIYTWAQATLNILPLPVEYKFDQADLWNRSVRILIGVRDGKDRKTGEDRQYNYVEDVMPAGGGPATNVTAFDDDF